uniref:Calponin-homology (CH) domain-containing protein n=1 Tax=Calidris pygmaea TaxID=425635 RepID=A0A8C3K1K6_9CHAR
IPAMGVFMGMGVTSPCCGGVYGDGGTGYDLSLWMEGCLSEELPPPTELEENLRNGVLLAKLGHCFAPTVVPLKKIYDREQTRYKVWPRGVGRTWDIPQGASQNLHVGLPSIFHPETTDIYDKKNMPRVIYCIHALSLYLFKLGLAPQIQDLYGKVDFTEEEINNMKRELEKYGLQLPAFSKIGGILANELSVDEAAVHAAVLAINEAVDRGVVAQTMAALRNPNAMLLDLREALAGAYQEVLQRAKLEKGSNARNRVRRALEGSRGGWERNNPSSDVLVGVDDALESQDALGLYRALQDPVLALRCLQRDNLHRYLEQLSVDREQKALVGAGRSLWSRGTPGGVAPQDCRVLGAVSRINAAIRRGMPARTLEALMDPAAQLPTVYPLAAPLYQHQLALLQRQHPQVRLGQEELFVAVEMLSAVALVNRALDAGDADGLWSSLVSPALGLSGVEDGNAQRYFEDLMQLKGQSREAGGEFLSWNDIQDSVTNTNSSVQDENARESSLWGVWSSRGFRDGGYAGSPAPMRHWRTSCSPGAGTPPGARSIGEAELRVPSLPRRCPRCPAHQRGAGTGGPREDAGGAAAAGGCPV